MRAGPYEAIIEAHRAPVHVGSIALRVRDLDRMARFYSEVVGLSVVRDGGRSLDLGNDNVVLLTLIGDEAAKTAPAGTPGLFHTAFVLPDRRHLGQWLRIAADTDWRLDGMADHLVSEAVYLSDPEGNGIEIYCDRPRAEWTFDGDRVRMANARLDVSGLAALADEVVTSVPYRLPSGARVGHVHLSVTNLDDAATTIGEGWAFDEMCRFPGAIFFATGGYHHHIAVNIWNAKGAFERKEGQAGLAEIRLVASDKGTADALAGRWTAMGGSADAGGARLTTLGGIQFHLAPITS